MKKLSVLFLSLLMFISFTACKKNDTQTEVVFGFMPLEFKYSTDADDLCTTITIDADGSFKGSFSDVAYNESASDYPNGTVYYAKFSGKFTKIKKLGDTAYSLYLENINFDTPVGTEEIVDGTKSIVVKPQGITAETEYILHLPETPSADLHEVFLFSWPYRFEKPETLSCYGLYNTKSHDGLFAVS